MVSKSDDSAQTPDYTSFTPASEKASRTLSRTRKKDTKCEVALRRALWHKGYRYRKHYDAAPGTPDIAFPGAKLAVFCDGDFWHGRNWEERRRKLEAGSNSGYWVPKIRRNQERDQQTSEALRAEGWTVARFWETDILDDPQGIAEEVIEILEEERDSQD